MLASQKWQFNKITSAKHLGNSRTYANNKHFNYYLNGKWLPWKLNLYAYTWRVIAANVEIYSPYQQAERMWAVEKSRACVFSRVQVCSVAGFLSISGPGPITGKAGIGTLKEAPFFSTHYNRNLKYICGFNYGATFFLRVHLVSSRHMYNFICSPSMSNHHRKWANKNYPCSLSHKIRVRLASGYKALNHLLTFPGNSILSLKRVSIWGLGFEYLRLRAQKELTLRGFTQTGTGLDSSMQFQIIPLSCSHCMFQGRHSKKEVLRKPSEHHMHVRGPGPRDLKGNLLEWRGTNSHLLSASNMQELYQSLYMLSFLSN